MEKNKVEIVNGDFSLAAREEHCKNVIIRGNLELGKCSAMFGHVTVENGTVSLDDYAFINELTLLHGGEIFFRGKRPIVRVLVASNPIVHVPKKCGYWTDFVQFSNTRNVTLIRDLD